MDKITILAACNLLWFLPSTILFILIHKYIQKKAPVWQSILDLLLLDGLKVMILTNFTTISFIYAGVFYGQLKPIVAQVILGFATSCISMIIIMQEIILILKALIIFKPGILTDQPDKKVIGLFRRCSVLLSCARFMLDYFLQSDRPCCSLTLELLTGTKMISRVSPGPLVFGMIMILCLTYIFIKIRAPKLPAHHKGRDFMKSVLMMVVSWIVAFIAYGSFMVKGRHTKIEEWLISQTIANTFSNFFVPLYYVYTTPNLNKYVKSFFVKPSKCRSNQVLPSVHFQNTSNTVVIQGVFN